MAFSPDGDRLASAGEDRKNPRLGYRHRRQAIHLENGSGKVMALCFCGADRLASGGSDNMVRVWDLSTQKVVNNFVGHTGSIAALASDPSGKLLVSGSFDTTVRLWQIDRRPTSARRSVTPTTFV